jgi:hypothetical protein
MSQDSFSSIEKYIIQKPEENVRTIEEQCHDQADSPMSQHPHTAHQDNQPRIPPRIIERA